MPSSSTGKRVTDFSARVTKDTNQLTKPPARDQASAIFGYILMGVAILAFLTIMALDEFGHKSSFDNVEVPVLFFMTMLGFVCIHPDLLKDSGKNLSTMRIVVFMMISVICILMLRIGWGNNVNFSTMGMTGAWVTIIGFTFGGKVAQSYIENKFPPTPASDTATATVTSNIDGDIAKLAADQNRASLMSDNDNISSVSDTVYNDGQGPPQHVIALYVKDDNIKGLPSTLTATMPDNSTHEVPTKIINNVGESRIQQLQSSSIFGNNTPGEIGSIAAMVKSSYNAAFRGALTAGHVFSNGNSTSMGGTITDSQSTTPVTIDQATVGIWNFQIISSGQDMAIAQLNSDYQPNFISFASGYYPVSKADASQTQVTVVSKVRGTRTAWILDLDVPQTINYKDKSVNFNNVIYIGSSSDSADSHSISEHGDSGGCVYVSDGNSNKLVGIILGGDNKFTYVLPVADTLNTYGFTLV